MTLIKTIQNDNTEKIKLKLPRNANLFKSNNIYYCVHYDTVIFAFDSENKTCEIDYNCSPTSNQAIYTLLDHFGIEYKDAIDVHNGFKNNYSQCNGSNCRGVLAEKGYNQNEKKPYQSEWNNRWK